MTAVVVLTNEGAIVRGKRRWRIGDQGMILRAHPRQPAAVVRVGEHEVILFQDEVEPLWFGECRGCEHDVELERWSKHTCPYADKLRARREKGDLL